MLVFVISFSLEFLYPQKLVLPEMADPQMAEMLAKARQRRLNATTLAGKVAQSPGFGILGLVLLGTAWLSILTFVHNFGNVNSSEFTTGHSNTAK